MGEMHMGSAKIPEELFRKRRDEIGRKLNLKAWSGDEL